VSSVDSVASISKLNCAGPQWPAAWRPHTLKADLAKVQDCAEGKNQETRFAGQQTLR